MQNGRQTWTVAEESGCVNSGSLYGFHLSLWFSFGSMFVSFLWIDGFPVVSWFSCESTSASFLWVCVILIFLWVCVYSYTQEERCASPKGPVMS